MGERENNEDSLVFWHFSKAGNNKAFAVICDGIGGLKKGEEASSYVVRQLSNWFMTEGYMLSLGKQKKGLQQLCYQIDRELKDFGTENGFQLGTTMTCVFLTSSYIAWAHYGDCRLYQLSKRKTRILTRDHLEEGKLVRALGVGQWHLFSYGKKRIKKGDKFLLCSDGFYRNLSLEELKRWSQKTIYSDTQANRMLKQLLERKKNMKEQDNISALYFGHAEKESRGSL